ncbi:hypothetical protein F5884DRAFT_56999 [Xylogone sp. PMI_703]|nr:hypothetical protein F5884DRAFT_56999 [Xylogone sp. PMI_703]
MVGVPGRSKGCHTCKQRRIRCTGERPQCSNCIKSKRICGGYMPKHAFILSQEMQALEAPPSRIRSNNAESGAVMIARWRVDPIKPSQPPQRTTKLEVASLGRRHEYHANCLPWQVSSRHTGFQQVLDIFPTGYLGSELLNERRPILKTRNWLLEVKDTPIRTPALESSILSICLAGLGRKVGNEALIREGLSMYTKGLSQLRQTLRNPRARNNDETLAACLALIMFESTECPTQSVESCMAHYRDAMNLMLLRSPEVYASRMAHCMLQQLRIASVFYGMQLHTRTFLADTQWRELPWKSSQKSLRDMLIDILLEMPEIYRCNDGLARETSVSKIISGIINITELCWQLDSQLNEWYGHFETFVAGPMYWLKLSKSDSLVDDAESGRVFPVAFDFPSYDVAQTMVLYWLALLLVHPILCYMYERLKFLVEAGHEDTECTCVDDPPLETAKITVAISSLCLRHLTMDKLPSLGYRTE